jgi:hypothetical protein
MKSLATLMAALILGSSLVMAQTADGDRESLSRQMNSMTSTEWRPGVAFGEKLAALPGSLGFEILRDNWKNGASVPARQQMFKGFVFNHHPDTLKVLNLGATDSDIKMQQWAFEYLKEISFIDFNEEYSRYADWFAKFGSQPLQEVRQANFDRFASEIAASRGEERESRGAPSHIYSPSLCISPDLWNRSSKGWLT